MRHLRPFMQHLIDSWPSSPLQWKRLLNGIYGHYFLSQLNDMRWKSPLNDAQRNLFLVGRIAHVSGRSYLLCSWEGRTRTYRVGPRAVHPSAPALMKCTDPSLTVALLKCGKGLTETHSFWRRGTHLFLLYIISGACWLPQLIAFTSCPSPAGSAPVRKCSWLVYGSSSPW